MDTYRILVVDDNRDLTDSLLVILEMEGHHAVGCYSGEEARQALQQEEFDILILDIKLPDIDGVHLYREIHQALPNARIFIITGYRITQILERLLGPDAALLIDQPSDWEGIFHGLWNHQVIFVTTVQPDFSQQLQEWLASRDLPCAVIHSKQSLQEALPTDYDVVVQDLHQPILTNLDVYLTLKESGLQKPTIALIYPHELDPEAKDPLTSSQVTGCMFKPFDPTELLNRIQNLSPSLKSAKP